MDRADLRDGGMGASPAPRPDFFTTKDGVKIHYLTLGAEGSWVVLIHGFTGGTKPQ